MANNDVYIDFKANMDLFNKELNTAVSNLQKLQQGSEKVNNDIGGGFDKATTDVKQFNTALNKTEGQIEEVERSIKEWQTASRKATNTNDLARYNRNIEEAKKELIRLRSVGTDSLKRVSTETRKASTSMNMLGKRVKQAFSVAIVLAFARGIVRAGKAAIQAHDVQIKKETQLLTALKGRKDITNRLIKQAAELQSVTTFGDEEIIDAQSQLAKLLGNNEEAIKKLTPLVLDFATLQGVDLKTAADLVAKSVASGTNALSRYGIVIEGAVGSNERLDSAVNALTKSMGGQAEAAARVGSGELVQLQNIMGDLQEKAGALIVRGLSPLIKKLKDFAEVQNIKAEIQETIQGLNNERTAVYKLTATIGNANTTAAERNKAANELNKIYPKILENQDLENINYKDLNDAVREYNDNIIRRIALEQLSGEELLIQKDIAADEADSMKLLSDAYDYMINKVSPMYVSTQGDIGTQIIKTIQNLKAYEGQMQMTMGANGKYVRTLTPLAVQYNHLSDMHNEWLNLRGDIHRSQKGELNDIQRTIKILTDLIGVKEEEVEIDKGNGSASSQEKKEELNFLEQARQDLSALNKERENAILLTGKSTDRIDSEIKYAEQSIKAMELMLGTETKIPFIFEPEIKVSKQSLSKMSDIDGLDKLKELFSQIYKQISVDSLIDKGKEMLSKWVDASIEANDEIIKSNEKRIDSLKGDLDREVELRKLGLRSNITAVQDEIEATQKAQQQALKKKEQLAKQEKIINNISTASNLVAANAEMIKTATGFGPLAPIIAVGLIAAVMTIFQNAAGKASNLKFAKGGGDIMGGRSHSQGGNPIMWHGQLAEAQRGEFQGIASVQNTEKYGDGLMSLFGGMKKGDNGLMISGINGLLDNIGGTTVVNKGEYKRSDLKGIERALNGSRTIDGNGYREVRFGNTIRRIRNV